jgi:hypothetical protein
MSATVFVSHAVEDRDDVGELVQVLKHSLPGVKFFVSSGESIPFGNDWRETLEENLREAVALLVVLSARSLDRPWIHFEAGFAYALRTRTFVALIDGYDVSHIPSTLAILQVAIVPRDLNRLINELRSHLHVKTRAMAKPRLAEVTDAIQLGPPGIYVNESRFDHANGWVRYAGSGTMKFTSRWIDPGPSFDNAYRFPPEDTLNASCNVVIARLLPIDRVDLYVVAKLTSDRVVKLYLSTSHNTWGFTGTPSDEFRVPLTIPAYERWHAIRIDLRTFAKPLGAPIKRIVGFKLRGGSRLSHILCLRRADTLLPNKDVQLSLKYPA